MNDKEYSEMPGIRRSDLWYMNKTPMHFKYRMDNDDEKPTPAMIFGQVAHKYILEPETYFDEYATVPNVDRRTKAGKEMFDAFKAEHANREWVDQDDFDTIFQMSLALNRHPEISEILNGDKRTEVPFCWTDDETGEVCKCKADILTHIDGKPYIIDYKTTDSCEDGHFERTARKFGYAFQTGFYTEGIDKCTFEKHGFIFIAQEKKAPYAARIYVCDDGFINQGKRQFHALLRQYHECKLNNEWNGYYSETLYGEE